MSISFFMEGLSLQADRRVFPAPGAVAVGDAQGTAALWPGRRRVLVFSVFPPPVPPAPAPGRGPGDFLLGERSAAPPPATGAGWGRVSSLGPRSPRPVRDGG